MQNIISYFFSPQIINIFKFDIYLFLYFRILHKLKLIIYYCNAQNNKMYYWKYLYIMVKFLYSL